MGRIITELVNDLVAQQTRIFELLEFDDRPVVRSPADPALLLQVEQWLVSQGGFMPKSYREFLLTCDGIENFSVSYNLFGVRDFLNESYRRLVEETRIGLDENMALQSGVLIGSSPETNTRVYLNLLHELLQPEELVVLEGNPGDMMLHESFRTFLEFRLETNKLTMSHLEDLIAGRTSE